MKLDYSSANEGSIVGLPVDSKSGSSNSSNSSSDHNNNNNDEEDSTDELTAAGDALCRSLLIKAQQQGGDQESPQKEAQDMNDDASDSRNRPSGLAAIDTIQSSTPQSTPPPLMDDQPASSQNANEQQSLDERVLELETKLATLSRILQQQQRLSIRSLVRQEILSLIVFTQFCALNFCGCRFLSIFQLFANLSFAYDPFIALFLLFNLKVVLITQQFTATFTTNSHTTTATTTAQSVAPNSSHGRRPL